MKYSIARVAPIALLVLPAGHASAQDSTLTSEAAGRVFEEAATLSARDGGRLWGIELYGPMLLSDPDHGRLVANQATEGLEAAGAGGVYSGPLPEDMVSANTSISWSGTEWTMLLWPLPSDVSERRAIIAHELWHRVQDDLGFPMGDAPNLHLGTRDGRVWIQLEWRALAAALRSTGDERRGHVRDALAFRARRLHIFPKAREEEHALLMHEGLAQYTGYALSGRTQKQNEVRAAEELDATVEAPTFVRSFAYPTGAAYGLLLDDLKPAWRVGLGSSDDLAELLGVAVTFEEPGDLEQLVARIAERYGGNELMAAEDRLAGEREQRLQQYRRRFIEGPVLSLDFVRMSVQFDPGTVDALGDLGKVYPSLKLTDEWGVLEARDGALITADWQKVIVPAPSDTTGTAIIGEGYSLRLSDGWILGAGPRRGDVVAQRAPVGLREVRFQARDGITVYGDLYAAEESTAPFILLFHQGASNARAEYGPIAPRLVEEGFNVLAIDQRRGGDRFGGRNRTLEALGDRDYTYCDCYEDLEATLAFARDSLDAAAIIAWGSSYTAALVIKLGVEHAKDLSAVLAFSPATGEPMEGCRPEPFAERIELPVLVLRPARELQLEHVSSQFELLKSLGLQTFVADPAAHASSMLNRGRVGGDVEPTWRVVLDFLDTVR